MRQHRSCPADEPSVIESRGQLANSERPLTQIGAPSAAIIDRSKTTERPRHATLRRRKMPLSRASSPYRQSKIRFRRNQSPPPPPFSAHLAGADEGGDVVNHAAATVQHLPRRHYSTAVCKLRLILVTMSARMTAVRAAAQQWPTTGRQGRKRQSGFVRL